MCTEAGIDSLLLLYSYLLEIQSIAASLLAIHIMVSADSKVCKRANL